MYGPYNLALGFEAWNNYDNNVGRRCTRIGFGGYRNWMVLHSWMNPHHGLLLMIRDLDRAATCTVIVPIGQVTDLF